MKIDFPLNIKSLFYFIILFIIPLLGCYRFLNLFSGKKTHEQVIKNLKPKWEEKLNQKLSDKNISFPPEKITIIGLKEDKIIEVWALNKENIQTKILEYRVLAASGNKGPKLKEGDKQVPEGIYKLEYLNPNSSYHLSMKINYPNEFDLKYAKEEGRDNPGTNIFIHGKNVSIGCLAIGDIAIEELYYLVSLVGKENVKVIISPEDFRKKRPKLTKDFPFWTKELYSLIEKEIIEFKN
ncbi:MAG: L,D-transpeptidase family protein [Leptospiraceae bacterium]|nr:L,D-transpeptidase family protein [Leptospiraceae bacterium]